MSVLKDKNVVVSDGEGSLFSGPDVNDPVSAPTEDLDDSMA